MPKVKKSFEDILLEEGYITKDQLKKAEEIQRVSSDSFKNILIRSGFISEQDAMKAYAITFDVPFVDLHDLKLELSVVKTVPQSIAQRHKLIPIAKDGNRITVAMVDPLNIIAIDEIRLVTGYEVEPILATEDEVVKAITQYYGIKMSISAVMEDDELGKIVSDDSLTSLSTDEAVDAAELKRLVEEAPIVRLVNVIIVQAIRDKSSDIHIEPLKRELRIRYRIDGLLNEVMSPPKGIQPLLFSRIKIMAGMDISERRIPQDGRIQLIVENKEFDFRVSTYPTIFGEKVVMRILDKSGTMIGLEKLGFPAEAKALYEDLIDNPYGMLLVTGPTGSGKTTTLYSALAKLNTIERNIITIEDPIEYQLDGINQIQVNEKAGLRFDNGLRHILRLDPDIIMIGEIRDDKTAEIATQSALTGHLVLSTLHTNDAAGATTRLIDMGIEPYLVSSSLIGVLAQRLVRTICPRCKQPYETPSSALKRFGLEYGTPTVTLYRGQGCEYCRNTGYTGRIGIFELMYVDDHIREMIVSKDSAGMIKEQARHAGMRTLQEDCVDKILQGITTIEEAVRVIFVED